jgi:branched-chain amino acid transport system permease protein
MDLALFFQLLVNGLLSGGMYALIASGFTLILGVMQIFNMAQGQFYMLGAFATFGVVAGLGLPYPVAILGAVIAMIALGIAFYFGIMQWVMKWGFFHSMLVTIAFATIVSQVSLITFGYNPGVVAPVFPGAWHAGDVVLNKGKMAVILFAILVMVILYLFMKTKIGTAMLASAENRDVAGLQGINAKQVFWVTMAVGCGLCGIAGAIIAPVMSSDVNMGGKIFIRAMAVVMIGGQGSMAGALIAAFLVGIIESFAYQFVGDLNLVVIFAVMGIIIYFRPGGLMGKPLPLPGQ